MINLKFDNMGANLAGMFEHPQKVMEALGISYQLATPQSLYDSWWFWGCVNVPEPLPPYLSKLAITPQKAVGYGLSQEQADMLTPFDMQRYAIDVVDIGYGDGFYLDVEEDRKGEWVKYDEAVAWGGQKFEEGKTEGFKMAAIAPPVGVKTIDQPIADTAHYGHVSCDLYPKSIPVFYENGKPCSINTGPKLAPPVAAGSVEWCKEVNMDGLREENAELRQRAEKAEARVAELMKKR